MNYKDTFKDQPGEKAGGRTGSQRVMLKGTTDWYQLKPSILDNMLSRRIKAGNTDRENFGEVIASHIGVSLVNEYQNYEAIPEVSIVYNKEKGRVLIASKHIKGEEINTLDKFIDNRLKNNSAVESENRHVKFVSGKANPANREYNLDDIDDWQLRDEIARGVAFSMLVGDHDVNGGNFIVAKNGNENHVSRIDLGHAFNDFINAPKKFGGQVQNKNNRIMDFLNREKVANIHGGAQATLWRDFPGLIPSQAMADAMKELSDPRRQDAITDGINKAHSEFRQLYIEMKDKKRYMEKSHLKNSLNAIHNNISGKKTESDSGLLQIRESFKAIEKFTLENQEQMRYAAKLMQLQVNIDKAIKSPLKNDPLWQDINKSYNELKTNPNNQSGFEWIRTDPNAPALVGNLDSYVQYRKSQLSGLASIAQKAEQEPKADLSETVKKTDAGTTKFAELKSEIYSRANSSFNSFMLALNNLEKRVRESRVNINDDKGKNRIEEVKELLNENRKNLTREITTKIREKINEIKTILGQSKNLEKTHSSEKKIKR